MHTTCTCLDGLHAPEHHSTGYRAREFAEIVARCTGRHVVPVPETVGAGS